MPIRRCPRIIQFALEDVRAEDSSDSAKEVFTYDGVLSGLDVEGGVFVGETFEGREERCEIVDVGCVGVDCSGEGFCLITTLE